MNLLTETKKAIKDSGHDIDDIYFIGSERTGHQCSWEEFCVLADKDYDDGFGSPQVALDLIFVFLDGEKMWRGDYDGSEWWEHSTPFIQPENSLPISSLFAGDDDIGWVTLAEIHASEE